VSLSLYETVQRIVQDELARLRTAELAVVQEQHPHAADGDAVHLELTSGDRRALTLKLGDGLTATLVDDDPVLELSVDGGKGKVTIGRDGAVTLDTQGDLKLKANKVQVEGAEIRVEASGKLTLKGATVEIN
jgi:phage baseplate assembly protein gpV